MPPPPPHEPFPASPPYLARLQAVTAALSQARTTEDVASVLALQAAETLHVVSLVVYTLEEEGRWLRLRAAMGLASEHRATLGRVSVDAPLPVAVAARTGRAQWLGSRAELQAGFAGMTTLVPHQANLGAVAALPLEAGGERVGALGFGFAEEQLPGPEERGLLAAIAGECAEALARAQLLDAALAARAAEERMRAQLEAVLEHAPLGIAFLDPQLRFVRVNAELATLNGLPAAEHVGKTPRELLPELPIDRLEERWRQVLATGAPLREVPVRGATRAAPGVARHWEESCYRVSGGDEVVGLGVIVRDVTAAREAEAFHRNVLAIVGHDLRTPVSTVGLTAQLLQREGGLSGRQAALVTRIGSAARRLEQLVGLLLEYARLQAGQPLPLHRSECALAEVCRGAVAECEHLARGHPVVERYEGAVTGRWDPARLAQVAVNLVRNAFDHGDAGAPVEVAARADGEWAHLTVASAGAIPPDRLPGVFDAFARARREGRGPGGLGLGLFITRAIVEAHGGRIEARSEGGRTVFQVALPRGAPAG